MNFVNWATFYQNANFGRISKLIFQTFDWFLSKSEELGIRKIDDWIQVQANDGANVISLLLGWIGCLHEKVVFHNIFI